MPALGLPLASAAGTDVWAAIPNELRAPVLRGLRCTVWLALAGVPFSFATRVLLARVGHPTLAAYGLLLLYINFVVAFLFLGGNAVAIRFLPLVAVERRRDFLRSYSMVVSAGWLLWLALAAAFPALPGWLLGPLAAGRLGVAILALAPLPIAFTLLLAALKGVLRLATAQALYRALTLCTFLFCLVLYWAWRPLLATQAPWLLCGGYLALSGAGALLAWGALRRACPAPARPRWFLPPGFWPYLWGLQAASMLGFFANQLDVLLVLHVGGLRRLGSYVALLGLVLAISAALKLLLEAWMSALAHALARSDAGLAARLWRNFTRLLLPLILLLGALLACCAAPLLALYGPRYRDLLAALRWLAPFAACYGLNCLLGSTLAAMGQPGAEVRAKLARIAAYLVLFLPLWRAWGVLGAVLAWGGAEIPYLAVNLHYLRRLAPFPLAARRLLAAFGGGLALVAALPPACDPRHLGSGLLLWAAIALAFFLAAGYGPGELARQLQLLLPGAVS